MIESVGGQSVFEFKTWVGEGAKRQQSGGLFEVCRLAISVLADKKAVRLDVID
jgi:hypothetical protein